jgi:hypothetical protein
VTVSCRRCGATWERDPRLGVDCPEASCRAPAGQHCRRPSGHQGPMVEPHVARERLAVDRGLLAPCPADPPPEAVPVQPRLF